MKLMGARTWLLVAMLLALSACARAPLGTVSPLEREAIAANLMRDIRVLASDEFGGRKPGTAGERLTTDFIIREFELAGLTSGTNDPGSAWRAPVALVSTTPSSSRVAFGTGRREQVIPATDSAAFTTRLRLLAEGADVVFVGRGAQRLAAEDVAGKVAILLGGPGGSPARRAALFELNPAAVVTVVADSAAIARLNETFGRERLLLAAEETASLTAFVTDDAMRMAVGEDAWEYLLEQSEDPAFAARSLDVPATIEATSERREFTSYNILGLLPGEVPGSGAVLLLAHWDHFGDCGEAGSTDLLCNGAIDNASGVAVMIELARRLKLSGPHDRDIYFLATTAEESGLSGAKAFAQSPPVPLDTIVAAFNFDTVAVAPAGSPVGFVGEGRTALDGIIMEVLALGERQLGDPAYAERFVQRQDGWVLLERGVPAVFLSSAFSSEITLGPYLSSDYHQPGDETEGIELGGAIDDLLLHEELVRRIADIEAYNP